MYGGGWGWKVDGGDVGVMKVVMSECSPFRLEKKSTGTPPQRW